MSLEIEKGRLLKLFTPIKDQIRQVWENLRFREVYYLGKVAIYLFDFCQFCQFYHPKRGGYLVILLTRTNPHCCICHTEKVVESHNILARPVILWNSSTRLCFEVLPVKFHKITDFLS